MLISTGGREGKVAGTEAAAWDKPNPSLQTRPRLRTTDLDPPRQNLGIKNLLQIRDVTGGAIFPRNIFSMTQREGEAFSPSFSP